jgi:hypothetical protein
MNRLTRTLAVIVTALCIAFGWVPVALAAPSIRSVTPDTIVNDQPNTLTIVGTDFDNSAAVILDGYGALATNFLNNQTLTAVVPAGIAPGRYGIQVRMSGSDPVTWRGKLKVNAPAASTPTPPPPAFGRPQMMIDSYKTNVDSVRSGSEFNLKIKFTNAGTLNALNVQAAFTSPDLVPLQTGGMVVMGAIAAGGKGEAVQPFLAPDSVYGKSLVTIEATVTYYDEKGTSYSDKFTIGLPAGGGSSGVIYPTSTPTGVHSAQLVITSYATTVDPLQPGEQFQLGMTVQNMGNVTAKHVTMIVGGGSSSSGGAEGTPQPGGTSGGGGEFTNFAPVGTSNIQSLGDLGAGGAMQVLQNLIVNVSTTPGAYPMKVTFSYINDKGEAVNDDQVITLLVYSLPNVDISFYREPDPLVAGQPGMLPIQVVNLGKRSVVLGKLSIQAPRSTLDPDSALVGPIDQGGYFTVDAALNPQMAGPLKISFTIEYTDDFNQPRTLTDTVDVTVQEGMPEPGIGPGSEGGGGGGPQSPVPAQETFLQKAWRFVLGLLGLDSAAPSVESPAQPVPGPEKPIIPPQSSGGKG